MKKKLTTFLSFILILSTLTACNNTEPVSSYSDSNETTVSSTEEKTSDAETTASTTTEKSAEISSPEPTVEYGYYEADAPDFSAMTEQEFSKFLTEKYREITPMLNSDHEFWAQFGKVSYNGKTVDFATDFEAISLCEDEEIYNEIYSVIEKHYNYNSRIDFTDGEEALRYAKEYVAKNQTEYFNENMYVEPGYFEINPEFFGFDSMEGLLAKANEIYVNITTEDISKFALRFKEIDGKLCVKCDGIGAKGGYLDGNYYFKYQTLLINEDENNITAICASPDKLDLNHIIGRLYCYQFTKVDGEWRIVQQGFKQQAAPLAIVKDFQYSVCEYSRGWWGVTN